MKMLSSLASNVEFHIFSRSSRGRDENVVHGVEESLVGEVACSGESLITVWGLLIVNERSLDDCKKGFIETNYSNVYSESN